MQNVQFERPEVTAIKKRWQMIRDCLEGQDAVKAHDKARIHGVESDRYLPKPNASDTSVENNTRYSQYIERAVFYPVTGRTHRGLVGQVFQKTPVIEVPGVLAPLVDDVDGSGISLEQQAKKTLGAVLAYGRCGLLADYPVSPAPTTKQQQAAGNVRPTIVRYDPWQVINWRTEKRGAGVLLTLVVLEESFSVASDEFETESMPQWRVLRIGDDGIYRMSIWRSEDGHAAPVQIGEAIEPKDSAGRNLAEIPFVCVGAENNDIEIDEPPAYDLAVINIGHYRNSADYEDSCFMVGQPTPVVAGLTQAWVDKNFSTGVQLGSRAVIPLPAGGSAALLQAQPNTMIKEAMDAKERQMVAIGAKLIEQRQVQRTASEAKQELATEISVLGNCAQNVSAAYVKQLQWCGAFAGTTDASTVELAADFELGRMTPDEQRAVVEAWQAKLLAFSEARAKFKNAGVATLEDESAKDEIASEPSYGSAVTFGNQGGEAAPDTRTTEESAPQA